MIKRWCVGAIVVLLCLSTIPLLKYRYLSRTPSRISQCPSAEVLSNQTQEIRAAKVVFKPWKGRHHVYGVFVVPAGYQPTSFFKVNAGEAGDYCGGVTAKPAQADQSVVIGRLRTRTALWLLSKGEQDRLEQPQNWTLSITRENLQPNDSR